MEARGIKQNLNKNALLKIICFYTAPIKVEAIILTSLKIMALKTQTILVVDLFIHTSHENEDSIIFLKAHVFHKYRADDNKTICEICKVKIKIKLFLLLLIQYKVGTSQVTFNCQLILNSRLMLKSTIWIRTDESFD